ncbi:hypothetical protein PTE30175_05122 [Pandoraea terrae]|uniref:Uncharacterized protein n=1 Tax=Pandoraea terrae TaxID=1537710 RepID=A0A5E4Z9G7_9BURK|nr:hypothetical protein [Pandoraea terrae]VVE57644.1 hypothetical protein PTE30175_05122 [Pandoraea terrae]
MSKCANKECGLCYPKGAQEPEKKEVPFDCVQAWHFYQKKAEAIVAEHDPIARNRRINAAYAQLWLEDQRFQWAGLAAFASKQVGCGLIHAAGMVANSNRQRDAHQAWMRQSSALERMSPFASPRMPMHDQGAGGASAFAYETLTKGNTALFLDIWPLHMFYKKYGLQRFKSCLGEREQLAGKVVWPLEEEVTFGKPTPEIAQGFEAIDAGNLHDGVRALARHEQLNILQPAMYDNVRFAALMRSNQFFWVTNFPTGFSQEIQLTLSNECKSERVDDPRHVGFSKSRFANLADGKERMKFVLRAADQFDWLLRDPLGRYDVGNALSGVARGRK